MTKDCKDALARLRKLILKGGTSSTAEADLDFLKVYIEETENRSSKYRRELWRARKPETVPLA